jgi:N-dimethylarginine dimethylaminohydrolase
VAEELARRGQSVLTTPFSAVIRHAGGLRCWSQPLSRID